ncbi:MAG: 2-amino-4-hydroxy-6-hydroxymethyldihydropteridine diphosphokinase [Ghiorsea sp.]
MATALIAFGGNLGEVRVNFDAAFTALNQSCTIVAKSKLYVTPALTVENTPAQPDYLNAAVKVGTHLSAPDLLQELHRIEAMFGRKRIEHWGARTLDLDLLTYDTLISNDDALLLPHPHVQNRLFVLHPLFDIAPDWVHPLLQTDVGAMIQALSSNEQQHFEGQEWNHL